MNNHSSLNECLQRLGLYLLHVLLPASVRQAIPSPLDLELDLCVATSSSWWLDVMISVGSRFIISILRTRNTTMVLGGCFEIRGCLESENSHWNLSSILGYMKFERYPTVCHQTQVQWWSLQKSTSALLPIVSEDDSNTAMDFSISASVAADCYYFSHFECAWNHMFVSVIFSSRLSF